MEMATNTDNKTNVDESNQGCTTISFETHETHPKTCKEGFDNKRNWLFPRLLISNNKQFALKCLCHGMVLAYILAAINHWYLSDVKDVGWKNGLGLLIIVTTCYYGIQPVRFLFTLIPTVKVLPHAHFKIGVLCTFLGSFVLFIFFDTKNNRHRLVPLAGLSVFILLGFIFSKHRRHVNWITVASGLATQITIGMLTIRWQVGRSIVQAVGELADKFFSFAYVGAKVTYGNELIDNYGVFAFKVLSVLFFMCFIIEILFYYGIIQTVVIKLGWCLQKLLGTTAAESVNTCASVFLGMSEAPIIIKPYLPDLTESEIHTVMMGGFSTVAGTVFAAYTSFGIDPAYLITASVMSAPTALSFSKLIFPETEKSLNSIDQICTKKTNDEGNVMDAACKGAQFGLKIIGAIVANIVAFVSFVAFINAIITWLGHLVGFEDLSFEYVLGKILIPVTWLLGVDPSECEAVGKLIGLKMTINEFVAYKQMGDLIKEGKLNRKSEIVATFALCSFANPGSIGSMIATLTTLCPTQRSSITKNVFRAFLGGTVTCFLTAAIASLLMPDEGLQN
ncbi:sodium/nucleoside cotransporter 2-like [Aphis gossypii]|uniref:Sodium/nucleoside cotransporter n=1 Tax=Aphis gossypii TaxID=80765 RepID=A0A9P0IRS8_APHGO|nr:sodium/nucleoside cotransporter 2-like [Aphis gossypii]XP_027844585.1 sodium/nucleoside cotransporter 2-like [Aphis gossypii]XP_050054269.1 sodium/nucleoside cotransporter 2-like [Aphis gossypii]XP_050054270.1 sodium/nucleoside cotransporter 2-like [Aphis gossypii]XP_050054271.1 sodium/nucleoside cotransporter 2-like [Aphis gossypii]XP_050054272.1 sodium/nucleoside cotransporter 2-like [Aphis gossypii]XP_050054273.1 sodium/nucleoside cotransporter 2-like [Aphis gossypii]XP_050062220.1 sod